MQRNTGISSAKQLYLDIACLMATIMPQICINPIKFTSLLFGCLHDLGFSFFSFHKADKPTPETFTTLNRTPGISPFALPFRPKPDNSTSSFSSTKLRQPSLGTASHPISKTSSYLSKYSASTPTDDALTTFHLSNLKDASLPNAVTFFPFLISCTLTHFRIALLGCFASTPTFSKTIPLACDEPPKGDDL